MRAADRNGLSDPYAVAKCGKEVFKTDVVRATLDPEFNSSAFVFGEGVASVGFQAERTITLELWDYDMISSDDFLGKVELDLDYYRGAGVMDAEEAWHDVVYNKAKHGEVLLKVEQLRAREAAPADALDVSDVDLAVPGSAAGAAAAAHAAVVERGDGVDDLQQRSDQLASGAGQFESSAAQLGGKQGGGGEDKPTQAPKACCVVQ